MNILNRLNKNTQSSHSTSLKKLAVTGFTLISLSALNATVFAATNANIPSFRTSALNSTIPKFELKAALPFIASQVPLIETAMPDLKTNGIESVAKKLGLSGERVNNRRGKTRLRHNLDKPDQQSLVMFDASGGFVYKYDNKLHAVPDAQPKLPNDAEALKIAMDYLASNNLLNDKTDIDLNKVTFARAKLSQFDGKSGRVLKSFTTGVDVRFEQNWGNIPVSGPGSKLYVSIGDGGEVVGLSHILRKGQKTDVLLNTISSFEAFTNLTKNQDVQLSVPDGCVAAQIDQFKLVYWSASPKVSQRVAWPIYSISGQCKDKRGQDLGGFIAYADAVHMPDKLPKTKNQHVDKNQDHDD